MKEQVRIATEAEVEALATGGTHEKTILVFFRALNLFTGDARAMGLTPDDVIAIMRAVEITMDAMPGVTLCDCDSCAAETETEARLLASHVRFDKKGRMR